MNTFVKLTAPTFEKAKNLFTSDVDSILKTFTSAIENLENHVAAQEAKANARAVKRAKLIAAIEASHNLDDRAWAEVTKARAAIGSIRNLIGA